MIWTSRVVSPSRQLCKAHWLVGHFPSVTERVTSRVNSESGSSSWHQKKVCVNIPIPRYRYFLEISLRKHPSSNSTRRDGIYGIISQQHQGAQVMPRCRKL